MKIDEYDIECSDFLGYDMPKEFLEKTINVLNGSTREELLYIMNEPGAELMRILKQESKVHFEVYDLLKSSTELDRYDIWGEKENCGRCLFEVEIDEKEVIDGLVTEFSLYENGNGRVLYEKNWDEFPIEQFNELKKKAYAMRMNLKKYDEMFCTTFLKR